ncbi:MAG TPA: NAD(P)/FAD-dependent oxidoreductase [Solirubrobacteraceae bacterium]|nr:NAD(P)/FAD-dependent oxidoreductase [Solirubrobacteraceae bacterium]
MPSAGAGEPGNADPGAVGGDRAPGRRHVVIVGGGFGGLTAARELRGADVRVTVVDRMHHHLFQPLLYQVACGGLGEGEIAVPIRAALRRQDNVEVLMAEATGLDAERRRLTLDGGQELTYDSLIVACGARTSYFGNEHWSEVTSGVKTLVEALALRNRLYGAFERAERSLDEEERRALMTFVVIGGGPTGVEVAGEIAIVCKDTLSREYARIGRDDARVILLDAGERVVPAFSERLSRKAAAELTSLGVSVRERTRATAIDEYGVTVQAGDAGAASTHGDDAAGSGARGAGATPHEERIAARTVIWAAGVRAAPFAATLAQATGAPTDRSGRVPIEPDLTVPGHREISLIGDASALSEPDGKPLPGLATVAIQQARHVAKAIRAGQPGAETPFRYFDKGALAVVGRGRAVCAIRDFELWGRPAFFMYLTVHMYYLGGVPGQRLKVLIDWFTARLGKLQSQVIEDALQR